MDEPDYPARTEFKVTRLPKTNSGAVAVEAWFDELVPPSLWIRSKDGEHVCIPSTQLDVLKKLIRRGRNP